MPVDGTGRAAAAMVMGARAQTSLTQLVRSVGLPLVVAPAAWLFMAGVRQRANEQPATSRPAGIDIRGPLRETAADLSPPARLGWLPALTVCGAFGLLLVALADTGARTEADWAEPLFWAGLLLLFLPVTARLVSAGASRQERLGLVVALGLGLYAIKLLYSPLFFTFPDELMHWRTADDLLTTHHLFGENSLLPTSPLYPGLENITSGLVSVSGTSIFVAGALVVGVARLALVLGLYLFYEAVGGSARMAGIASLLYMANPNFLFFDAQFGYESLALPFAVLTLLAVGRSRQVRSRLGWTLVVFLGLGALVTTHHVTAYALTAFLAVWAAAAAWVRRRKQEEPQLGGAALLVLVAGLGWSAYVATLTIGYLGGNVAGGVSELFRLVMGESGIREFFRTTTGQLPAVWERLAGYASVGLILVGLPFGLWQIWRRYRANSIVLALAAGALAYPASLALRLTQRGAEASNRTSEYLFVAVAFALAIAVVRPWLARQRHWRATLACSAGAGIIFVGGLILGWPRWARLPGPYLIGADMRAVEPEGLTAADWTGVYLGRNNRIVADRTNGLLLGSYGQQHLVTAYGDHVDVSALFFSHEIGPAEQAILRHGRIGYILIDHRLSRALPLLGVYVERGEPGMDRRTSPVDEVALSKFEGVDQVSRVFDSGDISIYGVGALADAP